MWLSILAAAGVAVLEYFTLQTYRSFRRLPAAAKAYHFRVLWLSSALILIPLLLGALGVPLPGLLWTK